MKKSIPFTKKGIGKAPNNKPGVYTIKNNEGDPEYIGMAKKGRIPERLEEHLPKSSKDPIKNGKTVNVQATASKAKALKVEKKLIKENKPPQNKRGK